MSATRFAAREPFRKGERPDVKTDGRYCTMDTANMFGVTRRTLDRWVESGKLRRRYTREGRPVFLGREILRLWDTKYGLMDF